MRWSFCFCFVLMGILSVAMGTERETGVGIAAGIAFHKVKVKRTEQVPVEELDEEALQKLLVQLEEVAASYAEAEEIVRDLNELRDLILELAPVFHDYKREVNGGAFEVNTEIVEGENDIKCMVERCKQKCKEYKRRGAFRHPDRAALVGLSKEEATREFQEFQEKMPFVEETLRGIKERAEFVMSLPHKIFKLRLDECSPEARQICREIFGMNFGYVSDRYERARAIAELRRNLFNKAVRLVHKIGKGKILLYSYVQYAAGTEAISDENVIRGTMPPDDIGHSGLMLNQYSELERELGGSTLMFKDDYERMWSELANFEHCRKLVEQWKKKEDTAPKELKVSKRCAKPIVELEGFREYQRGKFVAGAKVTLGTTFGKVKYCNDAYVAMAPMLGVKIGQRLVLYGLGGFMFQRLVSPLVGVGIKFNLSDRFYARLEGNRWSNKKVRANVIKLGFGWRL